MSERKNNKEIQRMIILLFLGWFVIWVFRTLIGAVHPEIMRVVGKQSSVRMGLISSSYFIGYVVMQIPGGLLMDRFGKRRILIPGLILMACGFLLTGFASSIETIYVGSVLAGIGSGTYYSGAFSLSTERLTPEIKYFATAIINSGGAFGMLVGYLYAALCVKTLSMDWRLIIFIIAIGTLIMSPLFFKLLRSSKEIGNLCTETVFVKKKTDFKELVRTLFTGKMIASYFFYFSTCYGYYMIVSWLPSFLQNERGFSGALAGYASSVIALVSIPGALFIGKIIDRFSKWSRVSLSIIQTTAAILLICMTSFRWGGLIVLSLALYGVMGKQAIDPLIVPHVTEQFKSVALSTGLGVFNFFGMSSSIVGPLINGYLQDTVGSQIIGFYIAAGLLLISSVFFSIVNNKEAKSSIS